MKWRTRTAPLKTRFTAWLLDPTSFHFTFWTMFSMSILSYSYRLLQVDTFATWIAKNKYSSKARDNFVKNSEENFIKLSGCVERDRTSDLEVNSFLLLPLSYYAFFFISGANDGLRSRSLCRDKAVLSRLSYIRIYLFSFAYRESRWDIELFS